MWHKRYRITWHVSPLDENPETVEFDSLYEFQDWVQWKENTAESFDLELCHIEELDN